jgi:hypothetical protein
MNADEKDVRFHPETFAILLDWHKPDIRHALLAIRDERESTNCFTSPARSPFV